MPFMYVFQLEQSINFIDIKNIESPEPNKVFISCYKFCSLLCWCVYVFVYVIHACVFMALWHIEKNSTEILLAYIHPFNGPLSGTAWVSRYQKGKTNLEFY